MPTITHADYWSEIASLATSVTAEARDEGRDIGDVLHEALDGHQYVIYTATARTVLEISPNDCAIFDELGPQEWSDWGTAFSQAAYYAMHTDVTNHEAFGAPAEEEEEEEEEEADA